MTITFPLASVVMPCGVIVTAALAPVAGPLMCRAHVTVPFGLYFTTAQSIPGGVPSVAVPAPGSKSTVF